MYVIFVGLRILQRLSTHAALYEDVRNPPYYPCLIDTAACLYFGSQATFHLVPIVLHFTHGIIWGGQLQVFTGVRALRLSCDFYVVSEGIDTSSREYK